MRGRGTARVVLGCAGVALVISGCGSGGDVGASAPPAQSGAAAASADPGKGAAGLSQLAAFSKAVGGLTQKYQGDAADYKAAVVAKDRSAALASAGTLRDDCQAELAVAPSGDSELDSDWSAFATECVAGWSSMVTAYEKKDSALITDAHAHLKTAQAHLLDATKRMLALGQTALDGMDAG